MLSTAALLLGVAVICSATDGNGHPDLQDRTSCNGGSSQSHVDTTARLQQLRQLMSSPIENLYQPLAAYIVPMDDEHLSEYISPHDGLVRYISGFTGSAGVAVVTGDRAAIWTDGRYFLQAEQQLDCNWILMKEDTGAPERFEWLKAQLKSRQLVGADATRMSALTWIQLKEKLQVAGIDLVTVDVNLIEHMWTEGRPALKNEPIFVHSLEYAGMSWMDKVLEVREKMAAAAKGSKQVEALLVTQLDEVAWVLNLRGSDMPHTPEFKGYAVVERNRVLLFVNTSQVPEQVQTHLKSTGCTPQKNDCVMLKEYNTISGYVGDMSTGDWRDGLVWIPSRWSYSGGASFALYNKVPESQRLFEQSPIIRLKAMKNPTEVKSMRNAHVRDSAALSDFLSLLEQSVRAGDSWTEMSVAARLQQFRAEQKLFRDTSFGTISAFGPHGAVIHYKPTERTDAAVDTSSLLLLDSGGQYLDGTTDVTRTMHYGEPEDFQREAYTRVLMGVIDLARVVFKPGTTDTRLDILARQHLWRVGLDYLHGTGHGIGLFLQVHEAPTQLRVYSKEEHPLEEGMFFSNEPGYYEAGKFGIRLETIMYVTRATNLRHNFSGPYLKLEPATLVPFERNLIKLNLLSQDQVDWLNDYHQLIRDTVGQTLMDQGRDRAYRWLLEKTQRISTRRECPVANSAESLQVTAVSIILIPAVLFLLSATSLG